MATAYNISLGPKDLGNFHHGDYNPVTAAKVNEVLNHNLSHWDIVFSGLRHNHIVHDILTIYGLGASLEEIQKSYNREAAYQRPRFPIDEAVVAAMADPEKFKEYLGQQTQYSNFLLVFQRQIEKKGVKQTLEEYLFAKTEIADELFARLYTAIFHGLIHIGFAFEFNQPVVIAEALSMGCIHDPDSNVIIPMFTKSEVPSGTARSGQKTLRQLMEELREDEVIRKRAADGPYWNDRSQNVAKYAMEEIVKYTCQYSISEAQLTERLSEMIDTCALLIATQPSAIKPGAAHKTDFFFLHTVNTLVLLPSLIDHEWISVENAIRMIEWAGRLHLLIYVAQSAPAISSAEIDTYEGGKSWEELFHRAINHPFDDGHLVKCIRSLAFCEKYAAEKKSQHDDNNNNDRLVKSGTWLRIANLVVDAVPWDAETSEQRWLLFWRND